MREKGLATVGSNLSARLPSNPGVARGAQFILRESSTTGAGDVRFTYGSPGDVPLVGDWDGDGTQTPGVYQGGSFYLRNSNSSGTADIVFTFGNEGDIPVVGDWDGDGRQSIGIFHQGVWHLRNTNSAGSPDISIQYGLPTDVPIVGDWDGNGTETVGVVRNGNNWILRNSNTQGNGEIRFSYGSPTGDLPIVGDWDGNRTATPGVYRGGNWLLRNSNTAGTTDVSFNYGLPTDVPLPGRWQPLNDGAVGTWYLDANGYRLELDISSNGGATAAYGASLLDENGIRQSIDNVLFDPSSGVLTFRRIGPNWWQWYRVSIIEGTMTGRFIHQYTADQPTILTGYTSHVTGWNASVVDTDIVPRAWDVAFQTGLRGKVRIDRSPNGAFIGRFKVYGSAGMQPGAGALTEELEEDVQVTHWDGAALSFTRTHPGLVQTYNLAVSGRTMTGTLAQQGAATEFVNGVRADVLGFGLAPKTGAARADWETKTRLRVEHLIMQDNPKPLSISVTAGGICNPYCSPTSTQVFPSDRDDNYAAHPQSYQLRDLLFNYTLPNPYGGEVETRQSQGWIATPTTPAPVGGFPVALVLNGHGGSASATFDPKEGNSYYFGDAFARRGFIVLAIDVDHRPLADRPVDYDNTAPGAVLNPDGRHPSVKSLPGTSDWEEDGERTWDAMRGLDYLLSLPNVNANRVVVTGHSMGGEISTYAGALDSRVRMVLPSGYSPDLDVMFLNDNHRCWQWWNADIREYLDAGDLQALVAPRPLLVQSGQSDPFFSRHYPTGVVKQAWRRVREGAYADAQSSFIMYSHPGAHRYWYGDAPNHGVTIPNQMTPPASGDLRSWELESTDADTKVTGKSLFDYVDALVP